MPILSLESQQNNFFSQFLNKNDSLANNEKSLKALDYLRNKNCDVSILNSYPEVRKMFVKYNAALPSSAVVERLFSKALIVYTPRRNQLLSQTFERILFVKHNKDIL